jgi:type IV secretion system protein VirB5
MSTYMLPRPKSLADAENEFLKVMGDPRRLNRYLAVALIAVSSVAIGLVVLNFRTTSQQRERVVVRIDDVGRAQAVGFTSSGYKAQPNETKYFLGQFVSDYYSRNRVTIRQDVARSMQFLSQPLAAARMEDERQTKAIEKFMLGSDEEVEVVVNNIVLADLSNAPYSAQVDLTKISRDRAGNETSRGKYVESITFATATDVPNSAILVNPLGFTVLSLREDQGF